MAFTIQKLLKYPRITSQYPHQPLDKSNFIGAPNIHYANCRHCGICAAQCPSQAISFDSKQNPVVDIGRCIYCQACASACPNQAIYMSHEIELAAYRRQDLILSPNHNPIENIDDLSEQLHSKIKKTLKRSLQIREVSAGSCNGCDYEANALNNPLNDLERLGITFVASPRHADMLLVSGAPTRNMHNALIKTYEAMPKPGIVIAIGACAISGGMFRGSYATGNGIDQVIPVDLYIPGCPPRPPAIMHGLLKALERMK